MSAKNKPNILYLHAHDAGRWIEPYGYPVNTPNLQAFAREATLFRKAFCVAPTCGPSRAALLTGQYPHQMGMFGLPGKQGWLVDDYKKHLVQQLNEQGYETVLAGVQHEANHADFSCIGYQRILEKEAPARDQAGEFYPETVDKVEKYLAQQSGERPFFLSVGIDEPHRNNISREELGIDDQSKLFSKTRYYDSEKLDSRYTAPPPWLPDLPGIRKDMESFRVGVELMDEYMGRVLYALDQYGLTDNTLVIVTSDHGIEFPGGKKTLSDQGLQVMLMIRGPEESTFVPGQVVEPVVSQLDVYPTICEMLNFEPEHDLEGKSLLPLLRGNPDPLHDAVFAEQTVHGDWEPLRCVRTERYKYISRHNTEGPLLTHDGPSTEFMESAGWYRRAIGQEELFDLYLDPMEACNRADDPDYREIKEKLRQKLQEWMQASGDVFPSGKFPDLPGA